MEQVIEKLAHDRSKFAAEAEKERLKKTLEDNEHDMPLFVAHVIAEFMKQLKSQDNAPRMREAELAWALAGFIKSIAPKILVSVEAEVHSGERGYGRADLLLERSDEKLLVELKRMQFSNSLVRNGLDKLDRYMDISGVKQGVLVLANAPFESVEFSDTVTPSGHRVVVVSPERIAT